MVKSATASHRFGIKLLSNQKSGISKPKKKKTIYSAVGPERMTVLAYCSLSEGYRQGEVGLVLILIGVMSTGRWECLVLGACGTQEFLPADSVGESLDEADSSDGLDPSEDSCREAGRTPP